MGLNVNMTIFTCTLNRKKSKSERFQGKSTLELADYIHICEMKMKRKWFFRICLFITLLVAANRIFAWTELNQKAKYTLQTQSDLEEEEEDDVDFLLFHSQNWDFKAPKQFSAIAINRFQQSIPKPFKLFIRLCNLRL